MIPGAVRRVIELFSSFDSPKSTTLTTSASSPSLLFCRERKMLLGSLSARKIPKKNQSLGSLAEPAGKSASSTSAMPSGIGSNP